MYNYNQYYTNRINEQQQVSVDSTAMPNISVPREYRQGATTWIGPARGHGVIDHVISLPGTNRWSTVFASITEMGNIDGTGVLKPFQGAASMQVLNIVPQDDGNVRVRVNILWGSDLWYKVFIARF